MPLLKRYEGRQVPRATCPSHQAPLERAIAFTLGTRRKGEDGRMWRVVRVDSKRRRWVRDDDKKKKKKASPKAKKKASPKASPKKKASSSPKTFKALVANFEFHNIIRGTKAKYVTYKNVEDLRRIFKKHSKVQMVVDLGPAKDRASHRYRTIEKDRIAAEIAKLVDTHKVTVTLCSRKIDDDGYNVTEGTEGVFDCTKQLVTPDDDKRSVRDLINGAIDMVAAFPFNTLKDWYTFQRGYIQMGQDFHHLFVKATPRRK